MSIIFITHDLGVVAEICDKIAVMYAGQVVEEGTTESLLKTVTPLYKRINSIITKAIRRPRRTIYYSRNCTKSL